MRIIAVRAAAHCQQQEYAMSPMLKFAVPITLALAFHPAQAQMLGSWSWAETNVVLTQADLDMVKTALAQQVHDKKLGTSASWSNPASGNSGKMTLLQISSRDGRRCEQIEYRMSPPSKTEPSDRFVLISCIQPDGAWKLSY
jgi:hypothetical protein